MEILKKIRICLLFGSLLFALSFKAAQILFFPDVLVLNSFFIIFISTFVGMVTNFIAIKMLFYPQKKKWYWHGLIPANQVKIAMKLAEQIEEKLLNVKTIMEYIEENRIIDKTIDLAFNELKGFIGKPGNRKALADWISGIYKNNEDSINGFITDQTEKLMDDFINKKIDFEDFWVHFKPKIIQFFKSSDIRDEISNQISRLLKENGNKITEIIIKFIENYIKDLSFFKRKLINILIKIDSEKLSELVKTKLESPDTGKLIVEAIDKNIDNIEQFLENAEIRNKILKVFDKYKGSIGKFFSDKAVSFLINKIKSIKVDEDKWKKIDEKTRGIAQSIFDVIKKNIKDPDTLNKINRSIPGLLKIIPIKQLLENGIKNQNTGDLEKLIMKVMGENLAAIEVLGGVIGGIFGVGMALLI